MVTAKPAEKKKGVQLWRCEICGDPYVGSNPPDNCPFCGAHRKYIKPVKRAKVSFDVVLSDKDRASVEHALEVEVSNSTFYFCAAEETDDGEGKLLFKALGKVEAEHAAIWKKILKLKKVPDGKETCHVKNRENLEESHARETRAINFYRRAAADSDNRRVKVIFKALVEVETDHLGLSEERLK
jgi:rubrerythrin